MVFKVMPKIIWMLILYGKSSNTEKFFLHIIKSILSPPFLSSIHWALTVYWIYWFIRITSFNTSTNSELSTMIPISQMRDWKRKIIKITKLSAKSLSITTVVLKFRNTDKSNLLKVLKRKHSKLCNFIWSTKTIDWMHLRIFDLLINQNSKKLKHSFYKAEAFPELTFTKAACNINSIYILCWECQKPPGLSRPQTLLMSVTSIL